VSGSSDSTAQELDGRRRRSQDSRARIVAAMLALVRENETTPSAEQVAERAGVGLRTVFRHFTDMDSLYREMMVVIEAELHKVVTRPFKGETWRERIIELIERRAPAFERIGPFRRAADAQRRQSPLLTNDQGRLAAVSREVLKRELPPEAGAGSIKFETLDLLLSYEAWSRLRREQGLSIKRAKEVLEAAVRRQLDD
jgi:AcrR family transcriptional regulator